MTETPLDGSPERAFAAEVDSDADGNRPEDSPLVNSKSDLPKTEEETAAATIGGKMVPIQVVEVEAAAPHIAPNAQEEHGPKEGSVPLEATSPPRAVSDKRTDGPADPPVEVVLDLPGEAELIVENVLPATAQPKRGRSKPAEHRDQRGRRRAQKPKAPAEPSEPRETAKIQTRLPLELRLRLVLHPVRRTATLSALLRRPDGYPESIHLLMEDGIEVSAYGDDRYDDVDLPWTPDLLAGELRIECRRGIQWLRSARQVHIFNRDPNEPGMVSVGAVRAGIEHAIVCQSNDVEAVRLAAASVGSAELQTHEHWRGIPAGWTILSGYTPTRAAEPPLPRGLQSLDPGEGVEISLVGAPPVRANVFAASQPPRILITPEPGRATVTIGGAPATLTPDGSWIASGWDTPGEHMIDVVPGPSLSYEIIADPWVADGWDFWDAHSNRFLAGWTEPWANARICGAQIRGPADDYVVAAETQPILIALGARSGIAQLRPRGDVSVSVGLMAVPPVFLISASGPRRRQGRLIWAGLVSAANRSGLYDALWVAAVRMAAARRLPLDPGDSIWEGAWRKAKERARGLRSRRPRT